MSDINNDENKKEEEFSFITEKIKDEPINKKKLITKFCSTFGMAVMFGIVACFTAVIVKPYMEKALVKEEDATISIPQDEIEANSQAGDQANQEAQNQQNAADNNEDNVVYKERELELEDYEKLHKMVYSVGKEASKSVVTVTGVTSDVDWFNNKYEDEGQASGIIIGDNGQEYLILTEQRIISNVDQILVTFYNDYSAHATLKKYDGNTGIAILNVNMEDVTADTKDLIKEATLGNSFAVSQGDTVLAIGSPSGSNYAISCGTILSTKNSVMTLDVNYSLFNSDIVGNSGASGVLINLTGEVVGVILQEYSSQYDKNTITAISVSELKKIIQNLSNGVDIPYLGIKSTTVTNSISKENGIPIGAFVTSVAMDSPAMNAGIQNGDVITRINNTEIISAAGYSKELEKYAFGDTIKITVMRQGAGEYKEIVCTAGVGVLKK